MSYEMYRRTTVGDALQKTLAEFLQEGQVSQELALRVLKTFDKCMNRALSQRAKSRISFKAKKLRTYRFCDNVWTFVMEEVEFRDANKPFEKSIDRVKFVACDGQAANKG